MVLPNFIRILHSSADNRHAIYARVMYSLYFNGLLVYLLYFVSQVQTDTQDSDHAQVREQVANPSQDGSELFPRQRHASRSRLIKRSPGNCVGKICQAKDGKVDPRQTHEGGENTLGPRTTNQASITNHNHQIPSPSPERESRSPGSELETLSESPPSSRGHRPNSANRILSLTETLRGEPPLRTESVSLPRQLSRSRSRSRSTGMLRPQRNGARPRSMSLQNPGVSQPDSSGGSSHGLPPRPHRLDGAGPSSESRTYSSENRMATEDEMRLHRTKHGWSTLMSTHDNHRWSGEMAAGFRNMVDEHMEPFRTGEITPQKIRMLQERNEHNIRDLLATEVAIHQVTSAFPNQSRQLQQQGLALATPSTHRWVSSSARYL